MTEERARKRYYRILHRWERKVQKAYMKADALMEKGRPIVQKAQDRWDATRESREVTP